MPLDKYQTVLPSSTRPLLGASQRLPRRAHVHTSRFPAPCTAYFVFLYSTQHSLINPYCDQIVPRPRGTLSSPRVPMPSSNKPDEGLGLGQGLLLGFNSLASPRPCHVSQSLGEHSGPASEPCPALPCPSPCHAHQAERSNDPRVCRAKHWKHPDTTRDKSKTRQDTTRALPLRLHARPPAHLSTRTLLPPPLAPHVPTGRDHLIMGPVGAHQTEQLA